MPYILIIRKLYIFAFRRPQSTLSVLFYLMPNLVKFLVLLALSFSSQASGNLLEIQCDILSDSPSHEFDFVIKRSPDTGVTYALLFSPENLETYTALGDDQISEETDSIFQFSDEEEGLIIFIDLVTGKGIFHMGWSQFDSKEMSLSNCLSTAN